jgi:hypothetical protein
LAYFFGKWQNGRWILRSECGWTFCWSLDMDVTCFYNAWMQCDAKIHDLCWRTFFGVCTKRSVKLMKVDVWWILKRRCWTRKLWTFGIGVDVNWRWSGCDTLDERLLWLLKSEVGRDRLQCISCAH